MIVLNDSREETIRYTNQYSWQQQMSEQIAQSQKFQLNQKTDNFLKCCFEFSINLFTDWKVAGNLFFFFAKPTINIRLGSIWEIISAGHSFFGVWLQGIWIDELVKNYWNYETKFISEVNVWFVQVIFIRTWVCIQKVSLLFPVTRKMVKFNCFGIWRCWKYLKIS